MTIRWRLYFFNHPSLWVTKIFWSPYYVAIENFQLPKEGGLVIFPSFWSPFWSPSNDGDQIQQILLSYLTCNHIWLNLRMDDCHFGYRGKGMWQGQANLVASSENPPLFFLLPSLPFGFFAPLVFLFLLLSWPLPFCFVFLSFSFSSCVFPYSFVPTRFFHLSSSYLFFPLYLILLIFSPCFYCPLFPFFTIFFFCLPLVRIAISCHSPMPFWATKKLQSPLDSGECVKWWSKSQFDTFALSDGDWIFSIARK